MQQKVIIKSRQPYLIIVAGGFFVCRTYFGAFCIDTFEQSII